MLRPDFCASARNKLLALRLSRRLVACGFSVPQVYYIYAALYNERTLVCWLRQHSELPMGMDKRLLSPP